MAAKAICPSNQAFEWVGINDDTGAHAPASHTESQIETFLALPVGFPLGEYARRTGTARED